VLTDGFFTGDRQFFDAEGRWRLVENHEGHHRGGPFCLRSSVVKERGGAGISRSAAILTVSGPVAAMVESPTGTNRRLVDPPKLGQILDITRDTIRYLGHSLPACAPLLAMPDRHQHVRKGVGQGIENVRRDGRSSHHLVRSRSRRPREW